MLGSWGAQRSPLHSLFFWQDAHRRPKPEARKAQATDSSTSLSARSSVEPSASPSTTSSVDPSASPSATSSVDPSVLANLGQCESASILQALPEGSTLRDFECGVIPPAFWVAVRVKSENQAYFLKSTSGPWVIQETESICSGSVKGMPKALLAYCPKR